MLGITQPPEYLAQAAANLKIASISVGRSLLQNSSANSSYPDFEAADTTTSDLTKEGELNLLPFR